MSNRKSELDFFDPFVGIRLANFWNNFGVGGRFDIGGFGVGSDLTYKYNLMTVYQLSKLFQLELGYQGYKPDYKDEYIENNIASGGFIIGATGINLFYLFTYILQIESANCLSAI